MMSYDNSIIKILKMAIFDKVDYIEIEPPLLTDDVE